MEIVSSVPAGVFKSRNFMTPHSLALYKGNYQGKVIYAELSEGKFLETYMWGVTVRDAEGNHVYDKDGVTLSKCCFSRAEADEHINSLEG